MNHRAFALVDCNNFYASCERLFNPTLKKRPVVVLSNNDGCIIARSNEAKRLGIPMGEAAFKYKHLFAAKKVAVLSSNYELYGDMSERVVLTLKQLVPKVEVYSIDESFLDLGHIPPEDLTKWGRFIKYEVERTTGIPVSVGIGPTKTLAKLANRIAKDHPQLGGSCDLVHKTELSRDYLLGTVEVGDVWGVGRRTNQWLLARGITTALGLKQLDRQVVKRHLHIPGERIQLELNGIACHAFAQADTGKRQQVASTRSFGRAVTSQSEVVEAVSTYTARVAEKLRSYNLLASHLHIFVRSNRYASGQLVNRSLEVEISPPSNFTPRLTKLAAVAAAKLYRPGERYAKAGVISGGLIPAGDLQHSYLQALESEEASSSQLRWLAEPNPEQTGPLMQGIDQLNSRYGRGTVKLLTQGVAQDWIMRQEFKSPRYTTNWSELKQVKTISNNGNATSAR